VANPPRNNWEFLDCDVLKNILLSDAASRNSLQLNLAVKRSENDVEATRARASVNKSPGKFFLFPLSCFSFYLPLTANLSEKKKNNLHSNCLFL